MVTSISDKFMFTFLLQMLFSAFVISVLVFILTKAKNLQERRVHVQNMILLNHWQEAQIQRLEWLKVHLYLPNPLDDQDYQELWRREIGAEVIMNVFAETNSQTSLDEYNRQMAQRE